MIGRCLFIFTFINTFPLYQLQEDFQFPFQKPVIHVARQSREKVHVPFKKPNDNRTYFVDYRPDGDGCEPISSSEMEACKYYSHCCLDVVRMRERLEPETYNCINIGNVQGN